MACPHHRRMYDDEFLCRKFTTRYLVETESRCVVIVGLLISYVCMVRYCSWVMTFHTSSHMTQKAESHHFDQHRNSLPSRSVCFCRITLTMIVPLVPSWWTRMRVKNFKVYWAIHKYRQAVSKLSCLTQTTRFLTPMCFDRKYRNIYLIEL